MILKDKTVLVTGGAVRLGRRLVDAFLAQKARVALHYHTSEKAAHELNKVSRVHLFQANLASFEEIHSLVNNVYKCLGTIDVVINNAAIFYKTPFLKTTEKDYDTFMNINLKAVFFLSQLIAQRMKREAQPGVIIHIADVGGHVMWSDYMAYCLSKSGVLALTKAMAKTLAPKIRVNCIVPGPLDFGEKTMKKRAQRTLLKKLGDPQDVVKAVLHAVTNDFMTGSCISVDGGVL